jgi:hypothetical protein
MAYGKQKANAAGAVKVNPYYQDTAVPLFLRKRDFAGEMTLRVIFSGFRAANRWAKANRPGDWDTESAAESRRKEGRWLKARMDACRDRVDRLEALKAPREILDGARRLHGEAAGNYREFLERRRRWKTAP